MAKKAYIGVGGKARKIKKGYVGVENFTKRSLPSGYTQVEYIESDGNAFIDTEVQLDSTNYNNVKFSVTMEPANASGVYEVNGTGTWYIGNKDGILWYGNGRADQSTGKTHQTGKCTYTIDARNKIVSADGVTDTTFTPVAPSYTANLCIGGYSRSNGTVGTWRGKFYASCVEVGSVLVRDYVPCTNASGTAGLYDVVNDVFYTNAGSGAFAAGSSVKSVARKIKKAYIGIGGVARPCWSGGELAYYGKITNLRQARQLLVATSNGNYALFGGGLYANYLNTVDAYDTSLVRTAPDGLSVARGQFTATFVGNYALFGGGDGLGYGICNTVDAYNSSLTRTTPTGLSKNRRILTSVNSGNYALFGGGEESANELQTTVDAYNSSLTRTTPTGLSQARFNFAAASVGNYALFGGGNHDYGSFGTDTVDAYNKSLTRTTATKLSIARYALAATSVGNYALFGGGSGISEGYVRVDAYDTSLTRTCPTQLSQGRNNSPVATTVGEYAIFAAGDPANAGSTVEAYDASLTRTIQTSLSIGKTSLAAATVGNYALFGGGDDWNHYPSDVVEAYTVV